MSRMMKKLTPETTISNLTGEVVFLIHEIRTKAPNSSACFIKSYLKAFESMFVNGFNSELYHNSWAKYKCFCICCRNIVLIWLELCYKWKHQNFFHLLSDRGSILKKGNKITKLNSFRCFNSPVLFGSWILPFYWVFFGFGNLVTYLERTV